jgi:hypothetical protein
VGAGDALARGVVRQRAAPCIGRQLGLQRPGLRALMGELLEISCP